MTSDDPTSPPENRALWPPIALTLGGLALMFAVPLVSDNFWYQLAAYYIVLTPIGFAITPINWKQVFRIDLKWLGIGGVFAVALWGVGWIGAQVIRAAMPDGERMIAACYAFTDDIPLWQVCLLLPFIVGCEDIVWRVAVPFQFNKRVGFVAAGVLAGLAFLIIQLPWANPILGVASIAYGTAWSLFALKARNFWAVFVAHLGWDLLALFWIPYG